MKYKKEVLTTLVITGIVLLLKAFNVLQIENGLGIPFVMLLLIVCLTVATIVIKRNIDQILHHQFHYKNIMMIILIMISLILFLKTVDGMYLQYHSEKIFVLSLCVLFFSLAIIFIQDNIDKKYDGMFHNDIIIIMLIMTFIVMFLKLINVLQIENGLGLPFTMMSLVFFTGISVIYIQRNIDINHQNNCLNYQNLDILKYVFSILILILHLRPFLNYSDVLDLTFNNIITRICVPMYFMITGYFVAKKELDHPDYIKTYIKKTIPLYLYWSVLYIPVLFITGIQYFSQINAYLSNLPIAYPLLVFLMLLLLPFVIVVALVYTGIYYHLWYFPAVMLSLLMLSKWKKRYTIKSLLIVSFILLLFGATETYFGVLPYTLQQLISYYYHIFFTTRNFLFFGLFYVVLGYFMGTKKDIYTRYCFVKLIVAVFCLIFEAILLHDGHRLDSNILISCVPLTYYLFISAVYMKNRLKLKFPFGPLSKYYYLIHPMIIFIVQLFCVKLSDFPFVNIICVLVMTHIVSYMIIKQKSKDKRIINNQILRRKVLFK